MDGDGGFEPLAAFALQRHVDHHDGVLLHDADQQQHADHGDDAEFDARQLQCQQCADAGRRKGRQDGDGMDVALVENAQHDIDGRQRRQHQQELAVERLLEGPRRSLEGPVQGRGHADLAHRVVHVLNGIAQGFAGRQVEGNGAGHEHALVVHGERRRAVLPARHRRERHQGFGRRAHRRSRRSRTTAADGDLVGAQVADRLRRIGGLCAGTGGSAGGGSRG